MADIGKPLAHLSAKEYEEKAFSLLYELYSNYDIDKPFLPQYEKNCTQIRALFDN